MTARPDSPAQGALTRNADAHSSRPCLHTVARPTRDDPAGPHHRPPPVPAATARPAGWLPPPDRHAWAASLGIIVHLAAACFHHQAGSVAGAAALRGTRAARAGRPSAPHPARIRRTINSATAVRCMFVTRDMATCLGLREEEMENGIDGASTAGRPPAPGLEPPSASSASPTITTVFSRMLTMRDPSGREWPVVYEAVLSAGQYHRHLTRGWREFCRHHQVGPGGAVEFRRGAPGGAALSVRVLKRGGKASK